RPDASAIGPGRKDGQSRAEGPSVLIGGTGDEEGELLGAVHRMDVEGGADPGTVAAADGAHERRMDGMRTPGIASGELIVGEDDRHLRLDDGPDAHQQIVARGLPDSAMEPDMSLVDGERIGRIALALEALPALFESGHARPCGIVEDLVDRLGVESNADASDLEHRVDFDIGHPQAAVSLLDEEAIAGHLVERLTSRGSADLER